MTADTVNRELHLNLTNPTDLLLACLLLLLGFALGSGSAILRSRMSKTADKRRFRCGIPRIQLSIQSAILQNISAELHDNIGQLLSVARMNLNVLEDFDHPLEIRDYICQTNVIIDQSIQDLRALTRPLDDDLKKNFDFQQHLAQELLRIRRTTKVNTELFVSGSKYALGYEKELILFQVSLDTLANAVKHSKTTEILAEMRYMQQEFTLSIKDNGIGFNNFPAEYDLEKNPGSGLKKIKQNIRLIGGEFLIQTNPGEGTKITVQIPV